MLGGTWVGPGLTPNPRSGEWGGLGGGGGSRCHPCRGEKGGKSFHRRLAGELSIAPALGAPGLLGGGGPAANRRGRRERVRAEETLLHPRLK